MGDYSRSARRSEQRLLCLAAAVLCAIALTVLVHPIFAHAQDTTAPDWTSSDQVLEIPQACIPDGMVMTCGAPPMAAVSALAATPDMPANENSSASSAVTASATSSANIDEASSDPTLGDLQDYETQGIVEAPIAPIYATAGTSMGPLPYFAPVAPVTLTPIPPVAIARPIPAGPWMVSPHYRAPNYRAPAPIMPFHMPMHPFRVR